MNKKYKYMFKEYIVVEDKKVIFANSEKSAQKQAGKNAILVEIYPNDLPRVAI